jgi:hypothetical protein
MLVRLFEHTTSQERIRKMLLARPKAVIYIKLKMPSARGFNDVAMRIKNKTQRIENSITGERLRFTVEKFERLVTLRKLIRVTRGNAEINFIHDNEIIAEKDFIINADDPAALIHMVKSLDKARPMRQLDTLDAPKNRTKKDLWRARLFVLVSNNFERLNGQTIATPEVSSRDEKRDVTWRFRVVSPALVSDTASSLVAVQFNRADFFACRRGFQGEMLALETVVTLDIRDSVAENILVKPPTSKRKAAVIKGQPRLL